MNEPTVSQIKEWLDEEISHQERRLESAENFGWQDKVAVIKPNLLMMKAIRCLIENQPSVKSK